MKQGKTMTTPKGKGGQNRKAACRIRRPSRNQVSVLQELARGNQIQVTTSVPYAGCLMWEQYTPTSSGKLNVRTLMALHSAGWIRPADKDKGLLGYDQRYAVTTSGRSAVGNEAGKSRRE